MATICNGYITRFAGATLKRKAMTKIPDALNGILGGLKIKTVGSSSPMNGCVYPL